MYLHEHVRVHCIVRTVGAVQTKPPASIVESDIGHVIWSLQSASSADSGFPLHLCLHGFLASDDSSQPTGYTYYTSTCTCIYTISYTHKYAHTHMHEYAPCVCMCVGIGVQGPQHVVVVVKFGFAFLLISFLPWIKVCVHILVYTCT